MSFATWAINHARAGGLAFAVPRQEVIERYSKALAAVLPRSALALIFFYVLDGVTIDTGRSGGTGSSSNGGGAGGGAAAAGGR